MRRLFLMAILASMTMPLMAQHIHVSTVNTSLVLDARQGGSLRFVYYGQRLNDPEQVFSDGRHTLDAYPAYGMQTQHETALSVVHTDGNMTLDLVVEGSETRNESNATVKVVRMKDKFYPFYVNVCYRTYSDMTSSRPGRNTPIRKRGQYASHSSLPPICQSVMDRYGSPTFMGRGPMRDGWMLSH